MGKPSLTAERRQGPLRHHPVSFHLAGISRGYLVLSLQPRYLFMLSLSPPLQRQPHERSQACRAEGQAHACLLAVEYLQASLQERVALTAAEEAEAQSRGPPGLGLHLGPDTPGTLPRASHGFPHLISHQLKRWKHRCGLHFQGKGN